MIPAVEPLPLRLPRDLLVLQPMQGHLDLEPVLLTPGLRCVIGSAETCAVRLKNCNLVRPEHCVVETIGRQTALTEWTNESTWLNDRLVTEPSELVPGDRVAIGPFDFRIRSASADELLYAKLVERESADAGQVEDVLRLKRAIDNSGRVTKTSLSNLASHDNEPAVGLFSDLLRETGGEPGSDTHDRLTQHISQLLGELQGQVLTLQEKEAELNEHLLRQREETNHWRAAAETRPKLTEAPSHNSLSPAVFPASVRAECEQVWLLLKAERDQLDRERTALATDQARWHEQQCDWSQWQESLESELADLETQRQSLREERDICRTLADELMRDEARMAEWEERLRREEQELVRHQNDFDRRTHEFSQPSELSVPETRITAPPATVSGLLPQFEPANWRHPGDRAAEFEALPTATRPFQTLLTLIAFSLSALMLGISVGNPEINSIIGWATAILGAISTVDLLLRRCFTTSR